MQIDLQRLGHACIILAQAIEDGRIQGVEKDIREVLGYVTKEDEPLTGKKNEDETTQN